MAIHNSNGEQSFQGRVLSVYNDLYWKEDGKQGWGKFARVWTGTGTQEILLNSDVSKETKVWAEVDATESTIAEVRASYKAGNY